MSKRRRVRASLTCILIWYDEPQLTVLTDKRGRLWMAIAIPDDDANKSMFFCGRVSQGSYLDYMQNKFDLDYLLTRASDKVYGKADIAEQSQGEFFITPCDFDSSYLPSENIFSEDHTEDSSAVVPQQGTVELAVSGNWEVDDFSLFTGKTRDVYGFCSAVGKFNSFPPGVQQKLQRAFSTSPWRGGYSSLHLYSNIYQQVRRTDSLFINRIHMSSPGKIVLSGDSRVFEIMSSVLEKFVSDYDDLRDLYSEANAFLKQHGFTGTSVENWPKQNSALGGEIRQYIKRLCAAISFDYSDNLLHLCKSNPLLSLKILMSFYRRAEGNAVFVSQGRISVDE